MKQNEVDFKKYYDLESYIFDDVSKKFESDKYLNAFDFFCIVIWKANRAKSKIAARLLQAKENGPPDLEDAVKNLTSSIARTNDYKEKMRILIEDWKFRLPMASAILTVLYPNVFTVFDTRVCTELKNYQSAQQRIAFESLWKEYNEYIESVKKYCIQETVLRDKDKWIWGQSFKKQLDEDIKRNFKIAREEDVEET